MNVHLPWQEPFLLIPVSAQKRRACWNGCITMGVILVIAHLSPLILLPTQDGQIVAHSQLSADLISVVQQFRFWLIHLLPILLVTACIPLLWMQFGKAPGLVQYLAIPIQWAGYAGRLSALTLLVMLAVYLILEFTFSGIGLIAVLSVGIYLWANWRLHHRRGNLTADDFDPPTLLHNVAAGSFTALVILYFISTG